jgi:hypothetical protein
MDNLGKLGPVWREADATATDYETVIQDMLAGQYKAPVGVFAFNAVEGWCRNVSEDVANDIRRRCDLRLTRCAAIRFRISSNATCDMIGNNSHCGWCSTEPHDYLAVIVV